MPELIIRLGDTTVQRYTIEKDVVSIGRARDNDIVVENLSISRNHARIRLQDGVYVLTDLNSANGSYVNGQRATKVELKDGDIISVGKHRLTFLLESTMMPGAPPPTVEAAAPAAPAQPASGTQKVTAPKRPQTIAEVPLDDSADAVLVVTRGRQANQVFPVPRDTVTIGRGNNTGIRLHDWHAGKEHIAIERRDRGYYLRDLGSWRGVTVNGEHVSEAYLKNQDEIVLGTTVLTFKVGDFRDVIQDLERESQNARSRSLPQPPEPSMVVDKAPEGARRPVAPEDEMSSLDPIAASSLSQEAEEGDETSALDVAAAVAAAAASKEASKEASRVESQVEEGDDEFAPMTDEELAELEMEAEQVYTKDADLAARMELEELEAQKLLQAGGGWRAGALVEPDEELAKEEDGAVPEPDGADILDAQMEAGEFVDEEKEDGEEEESLFRGPVTSAEPGSIPDPPAPPAAAAKQAPAVSSVAEGALPPPSSIEEMALPDGVDPAEAKRWLRGLRNKSRLIRREAARKLKELTGTEYDWESPPGD